MKRVVTRARPQDNEHACVLFDCHSLSCALPVDSVVGMLSAQEARLSTVPAAKAERAAEHEDGCDHAVLEFGGERFATWDLGHMLELPSLTQAWILLSVPHRGTDVPLALRTGRYRLSKLPRLEVALPEALFRQRRAAFRTAFVIDEAPGSDSPLIGLGLNTAALWTKEELDASSSRLRLAEKGGA